MSAAETCDCTGCAAQVREIVECIYDILRCVDDVVGAAPYHTQVEVQDMIGNVTGRLSGIKKALALADAASPAGAPQWISVEAAEGWAPPDGKPCRQTGDNVANLRDQLADFTALAWAIIAARHALAVLAHDGNSGDALGCAISVLGERLCATANALAEAMTPRELASKVPAEAKPPTEGPLA